MNDFTLPAPIFQSTMSPASERLNGEIIYKIKNILNITYPHDRRLGNTGSVYARKKNPFEAVKKSPKDLTKEYLIGCQLSHNFLCNVHQLKILKNKTLESTFYQLTMEKIEGESMTTYYTNPNEKLSYFQVKTLLNQGSDVALYLFEKGIAWSRIKEHQIFLSKGQLKICDFGEWLPKDKLEELTLELLIGSMEFAGWVIKSSFLRLEGKNENLESSILFPKSFFQTQEFSGNPNNRLFRIGNQGIFNNLAEEFKGRSREDLKNFIKGYFEAVLTMLVNRFETTIQ